MSEEWMNRVEEKIDGLGRRMDGLDGRMDRLEVRIDGVETRLDERIDDIEVRLVQRIDSVETGLGQRIDGVEVRLGKLDAGQQKLGVELEERASEIHALAEGLTGLSERMDRGFADVLAKLNERATPLEAASRYFATKLGDRAPRPPKRQRRKRH